jgi:DNA-binding CsgD family transcriptional regulator
MENLLDRLSIPVELERWQQGDLTRRAYSQVELFMPAHQGTSRRPSLLSLSQQYEQISWRLEQSLGTFRRFVGSLTSPPPLGALRLEARIAWECFDEGDPEPLDRFIRRRLGVMSKHDGPLPDDVRHRVIGFLDYCLPPVPLYEPGEWFLLASPQVDHLAALIGDNIKAFPRLKAALLSDGKPFRQRLAEELPGLVRVAWDDIETGSDEPLLMKVSRAIGDMRLRNHILLVDEMADVAEDDTLARFEAGEAARQEVNLLDLLEEEAALSPQQAEVWTLLRQGVEIEEIASMLGKTPNHISVQKHNAVRKLKQVDEVRAAAGR